MGNETVLQAVSKTYRRGRTEIPALRDITLTVPAGAFCCVLGPSGAGKTTLLNLLGVLDVPTAGTLRVTGELVADEGRARIPARRRDGLRRSNIGMVFPEFYLIPTLTAWENVQLPLVWTERRDPVHARELLERVGLGRRLHHRPSELSGGEMQRVAIARALVNRPQLLLADEPTGNVDTRTRDGIFALFHELHADGLTIVMATHDQALARQLDLVVQLHGGKLNGGDDAVVGSH